MEHTTGDVVMTLIGGPTLLMEVGGRRILTDPTFSPPGAQVSAGGATLVKLRGPAVSAERIGEIDVVLLSHDQHADNLDLAGRELLPRVSRTISTRAAADRLPGVPVTALSPWHSTSLEGPGGSAMAVTATPAHHGPEGTEDSSGPVIGFVLTGPDLPAIYVSGDNASTSVIREIEHHLGPIAIAVLFAGAARTGRIDAYVSLTSSQVTETAAILPDAALIPAHYDGWAHFQEGEAELTAAIAAAPEVASRIHLLRAGVRTLIEWGPT